MSHSLTITDFLANPNEGLSEFISIDSMKQAIEESSWNFHRSVFDHTMKVFGAVDKVISLQVPYLELLKPIKQDIAVYVDTTLGTHSRRVLLKAAVLLHDLGKVSLMCTGEREGTGCPGHAEESRRMFELKSSNILPLPMREHNYVSEIIGKHHDADRFICCQGEEQCAFELQKYRDENESMLIDLLLFYLCDFEGSKINFMVERQKPLIWKKISGLIFDAFKERRSYSAV